MFYLENYIICHRDKLVKIKTLFDFKVSFKKKTTHISNPLKFSGTCITLKQVRQTKDSTMTMMILSLYHYNQLSVPLLQSRHDYMLYHVITNSTCQIIVNFLSQ